VKVTLVRAWPRRWEALELVLAEGACVEDALVAGGWAGDPDVVAFAVFGQRVERTASLQDGDRLELLRPLVADPKLARRQRVETRRQQGRR
jgi:putative ubiquitin-RnfH superfamily antitoxin RatB of RatAB toxin-antitoxin module